MHSPEIRISREGIRVKDKLAYFDAIEIDDLKLVVRGKYIKKAELRAEWDQDVDDPMMVTGALKRSGIRVDLLSFIQRLPESRPKFNYTMEWDSIAAVPISTHEQWMKYQIPDQVRNKIKKAKKTGVEIRLMEFDDELVQSISGIYNDTPIRQGHLIAHYNMPLAMVRQLNGTYLERCDFFGAFYKEEMIGYLKIVYSDKYARVMGIMGKTSHQDKAPMNLLISRAIEICASKNVPYLVYARYDYGKLGSDSLKHFKKSNGFENILIPRYYIPLNGLGKVALKLRLHKGVKNLLPRSLIGALIGLRNISHKCALLMKLQMGAENPSR